MVFGDQLCCTYETVESYPRCVKCSTDIGTWLMAHLGGPISLESLLHGYDVLALAGQEAPLLFGPEPLGILLQARWCIVFRINGNGDHADVIQLRAQSILGRREHLAQHGTDRRAGRKDKLQQDRSRMVQH